MDAKRTKWTKVKLDYNKHKNQWRMIYSAKSIPLGEDEKGIKRYKQVRKIINIPIPLGYHPTFDPKTKQDIKLSRHKKDHNKKRLQELHMLEGEWKKDLTNQIYHINQNTTSGERFSEWAIAWMNDQNFSKSYLENLITTVKHVKKVEDVHFLSIDTVFINRFIRHLNDLKKIGKLEQTTVRTYYERFLLLLKNAEKDKKIQMELVKEQIRIVGKAGIPVFGYNFSLAGVSSRTIGKYARGKAESVGMEGNVDERPIANGMVWNMIYDNNAPKGTIPRISHHELWKRLHYFLDNIIPVAEKAGVKMAAHPDDPPMPYVRNTPRLVYQPQMYQRLLDMKPSAYNNLEFCLGSIAEMTEGDVYEATNSYSKQQKIAYIHFRNVIGKVPYYKEVFVDEGDIDMIKILKILKSNNFKGILIPDHTPQMTCEGAWYAGMAYAMGYMKALLKLI